MPNKYFDKIKEKFNEFRIQEKTFRDSDFGKTIYGSLIIGGVFFGLTQATKYFGDKKQ